jgi:hypothetical protein
MKGFELLVVALLGLVLVPISSAQYWFQSGAVAGSGEAQFNAGAGVSIQTIYPQEVNYGSFGFWVGETLSNGAFLQVGYEIPNQTGTYPTGCLPGGCAGNVYLEAGQPAWFWEYFPSSSSTTAFYGDLGRGNFGINGSFSSYSFKNVGGGWYFYMDNKSIGSVNLGATDSGTYSPLAMAEYANAPDNRQIMLPVQFRDFSFYKNGLDNTVAEGYSYIGYGRGSLTSIKNPYGISEVSGLVNTFKVGSGLLIISNNTLLWRQGYALKVSSEYANLSRSDNYLLGFPVVVSAPKYYNISSGERAAFVGWHGSGPGSYTGQENATTVDMLGSITETAVWKLQYYLNVSRGYGVSYGSGWYDNGSLADFGIESNTVTVGYGTRAVFRGWSNGDKNASSALAVDSPSQLAPHWTIQYLVNLTSQYSSTSGSGWYDNGSIATIGVSNPSIIINQTSRFQFNSWSNEYNRSNLAISVHEPIFLTAMYGKQYLVNIYPEDAYGNPIIGVVYATDVGQVDPYSFLPANSTVNMSGARYKGVYMPLNRSFYVDGPLSFSVALPVYNLTIRTLSFIYTPVDASLNITFQNGTTISASTGDSGALHFEDVPLGYARGRASYIGIVQEIKASSGKEELLLFFTPFVAVVLMLCVGAAVVVLKILSMRKRNG